VLRFSFCTCNQGLSKLRNQAKSKPKVKQEINSKNIFPLGPCDHNFFFNNNFLLHFLI